MALPRDRNDHCRQFAGGFCTPRLVLDKSAGILHPEVGAGQTVPEFCKAGRTLNKIMGEIVKEQNHYGNCSLT